MPSSLPQETAAARSRQAPWRSQPPVPRGPHAMTICPMATGPGRTTRRGRVRHAAVRRAGCDGRGARPCLIGGLVDCRPHRRREPGTGLRHLGPMRCGHIPRERENYPYQHRADCRGEPRPTAGTEEPPWSRLSTHDIFPSHGNAAYQRAEQRGLASSEGYFSPLLERCPRPGNGLLPAGHRGHIRRLSRRAGAHDACRLSGRQALPGRARLPPVGIAAPTGGRGRDRRP